MQITAGIVRPKFLRKPLVRMLEDPTIKVLKFALGENVKRSRSSNNRRYPDTRMGVEQIIRDRFKAALDYEKKWQQYNSTKKKNGVIPPRRDLELETLLEIIHGKRLVSRCAR